MRRSKPMGQPLEFKERKIRSVDENAARKVLDGATADKFLLENGKSGRNLSDVPITKKEKGVRINFFLETDLYEALLKFQFKYKSEGRLKEATLQKLGNDGLRLILKDFLQQG